MTSADPSKMPSPVPSSEPSSEPHSELSLWRKTKVFLEAIKVSHSIFALPFAVSAAFMAEGATPNAMVLAKIVLACVLARTAAMAFNRLIDATIDAKNPRTMNRALPSGQLNRGFMLTAVLACCIGFVATASWINDLAARLSPVVLAVLLGYSYTKRFTSMSHLVLGIALGLSPLGAWVAVRGSLEILPLILGLAVLFWTAGFDIIYSCQDVSFDRRQGLHSIPGRIGIGRALMLSRAFHALTAGLLIFVGWQGGYGPPYAAGVLVVSGLLLYEHSLVRADDLSRVNVAFFTLNGLVSLLFMAAVITEILLFPAA